jgi:hypothetical protein
MGWTDTFKEAPITEATGFRWKVIFLYCGDDFVSNL